MPEIFLLRVTSTSSAEDSKDLVEFPKKYGTYDAIMLPDFQNYPTKSRSPFE